MTKTIGWLLAAVLVGGGSAQAGKLYKWVDEQGQVSYHDRPPADETVRVEETGIRTGSDERVAPVNGAEPAPVVLYAMPKCGACDLARAHLRGRDVPFTEKNPEGDVKVQQELRKLTGGLSVPTITVGTKLMRGYMDSILDDELTAAGYAKPAAEAEEKEGAE